MRAGRGSPDPAPLAPRPLKPAIDRFPDDFRGQYPVRSWTWGGTIMGLFRMTWFVITLPFRLVFLTIALLGRLTGLVLGFTLIVVGTAFLLSPLFLIGIPLLVIGLVLTLRCLE
ncbi:MAG: hypothetical protein ACLQGP_01665 [Isosphaeraceae bacterium]